MDKNETVDNVLRVMRNETFFINGKRRPDVERYVRMYAERIDAARKREHGNAAKSRKALERIASHYVDDYCACPDCSAHRELRDIARAALSAPPRNCDRFATKDEAWNAFAHAYFGPTDPGFIEDAFARWLFAPAKEGGGHADA